MNTILSFISVNQMHLFAKVKAVVGFNVAKNAIEIHIHLLLNLLLREYHMIESNFGLQRPRR